MLKNLNLSKATKAILIANIAVFVLSTILKYTNPIVFYYYFVGHPMSDPDFNPIQIVTHMFVHGGIIHLLFNMLTLVFLSNFVEKRLNQKQFLIIYFVSGLASYFAQSLLTGANMVGASGCLMGTVMSFCYLFPYEVLSIFFIFKCEARKLIYWLLGIETVFTLLTIFTSYNDGIGHAAHLFGGLAGLALTHYFKKPTHRIYKEFKI